MSVGRRTISRADLLLGVALSVILVAIAVAMSLPRAPGLDERARAIESQLRCPTCQGLSIADSPATSATQMRALVREQLASGASDDEVRAFFVARYGRWILLEPPASGIDLALWLVPALIVTIGGVLVVRRVRARAPAGAGRLESGAGSLAGGRLSGLLIGGGMVLALVVPIAAAVGPRLAGQELTGSVPQSAPSIEELEAVLRAQPGDVQVLVALGDALLAANRPGDAAERYKAALELDPNNVRALLGIGTILLAADRPDAAGPVFDRILATSPDQPDALLYRAVARLRLHGTATEQVRSDVARFLQVAAADDPRRAMATSLLEAGTVASPVPSEAIPSGTP